jgi:hypothetical protein
MMCRGIDDLLRSSWAFASHQLREPVLVAPVLDFGSGTFGHRTHPALRTRLIHMTRDVDVTPTWRWSPPYGATPHSPA